MAKIEAIDEGKFAYTIIICLPGLRHASALLLCPCHTSKYDLAGRVFKVGPATANLAIPACRFVSENRLLLGVDA